MLPKLSDWFSTLLQIANRNETLLDDEIDDILSDYNDTTDIDAIGLWPDILSQCGYIDNTINETISRTTIISGRTCGENDDEDQYLFASYIRAEVDGEQWKLIVNHSTDCNFPNRVPDSPVNYWIRFSGQSVRVPDFDVYDQYMENENIDSALFRSECLDEIDESERNENNTLFWYDDIMLFRIDADPIEACDIADNYTDIVDVLLEMLEDSLLGNYYGSYIDPPTATSALVQFTSWDCGMSYIPELLI